MGERETNLFVGGLVAIGFDRSCKYLLVVSSAGRGLFSTATWEKIARDRGNYCYEDDGTALGIGPMEGQLIPVTAINYRSCVLEMSSPNRRINLRYEDGTVTVWDDGPDE
jgi:hypothetical protein